MKNFENAVRDQIDRMINLSTELFYVEVGRDELFELYLASFPEGENKIYRKRTVHDCNACKSFIRKIGNVIAVVDGQLETIWDVELNTFHQGIADALAQRVRKNNIAGIYRAKFKKLGSEPHQETLDNGIIMDYEHFHYILPPKFILDDLGAFQSNAIANKTVLERSLKEISFEASEYVLDLIEENQLYRGTEHLQKVKNFQKVKLDYDLLHKTDNVDLFLWMESAKLKEAGRFRNNVMGTLLLDVSSGTELEVAVGKFESKVDSTNYKRSTAVISQPMINKAQEKVVELGIEKSLDRRHATFKDLTINNVLFVDKSTKKKMKKEKKKKSVLDNLLPTKNTVSDKTQQVTIDEFVTNILPHATSMEIMVKNSHTNNFMSVIAPINSKSPNIMKWENPFSWSYNGEVTDSIRERVKRAGGDVEGFMRCSLSWYNHDDLDIHAIEPDGSHIYYGKKTSRNGELDVDMNVSKLVRDPVENITWRNETNLQEGKYKFYVNNYQKRETDSVGFQVEMELDGKTYLFAYDKPLRQEENVTVIEFIYSHKNGILVEQSLPSTQTSKEVWNVATHQWTKVSMMMNSPNFWNGEQVGNKHWFFIIDACLNPDKARGFYNEFLRKELHDHRKVFEVLSSKMKTEYSDKQLSGVGFSSTQENSLLCKVSGKYERIIEITFAPSRNKGFDIVDGFIQGENIVHTDIIGRCEVCKRDIYDVDSRLPCPHDCNIFHTSHFLEYVRVSGKCPVCRRSVSQIQIDEIVQLITV